MVPKPERQPVLAFLNRHQPRRILDAPSGLGWLATGLNYDAQLDGVDLFEPKPHGYHRFWSIDLGLGLPDDAEQYDAVVCCEGIEHVGNPDLLLRTAFNHLAPGGLIVVTTPNVWYPQARLQYLLRGFFPSFPCLTGRIRRGDHMHISPWSFPQLHLYLAINEFENIQLHDVPEPRPKHFHERIIGAPQRWYCQRKENQAPDDQTKAFWRAAGSVQSTYGRRLVVTASKPH